MKMCSVEFNPFQNSFHVDSVERSYKHHLCMIKSGGAKSVGYSWLPLFIGTNEQCIEWLNTNGDFIIDMNRDKVGKEFV